MGAAWKLNSLCFKLSVPVLLILFFYSYTKRFTSYSHLVLGFCLGMAPLGTWIAVRGDVRLTPVLLCLIVMLWTAGFDIIYACQDVEFDRQRQLFSLPKRLGVRMALNVSTGMHVLMLLLLVALFVLEAARLGQLCGARLGGRAAMVRAQSGSSRRPVQSQCILLHRKRMHQRVVAARGGIGQVDTALTAACRQSQGSTNLR